MTAPPTNELGQAAATGWAWGRGTVPWSAFVDDDEYVPELTWPTSVATFRRMRADTQLGGLLAASTLPIRRYNWSIDPNGARPEVVAAIAEDFNLPLKGADPGPRRRSRNRFSHDKHLERVLDTALVYGHAFFEQFGVIEGDLWRLRKLGELAPRTIGEINVAKDGGLVSIKQSIGAQPKPIGVERLVAYALAAERGNWVGTSLLHDCYRNWLIKDRLLRVDAINHEKAGGIHIPEAPPNATQKEIADLAIMAQKLVVGEHAGGAVPSGTKWNKVGSPGTDTIGSIKYHDESMARRFLAMFLNLGHDNGARALGDTFVDFFSLAQESIAIWYRDTTNEHVIEDWVDWNYGEAEELVPLLDFEVADPAPNAPTQPLQDAVNQGTVAVDNQVAAELHHKPAKRRPRRHLRAAEPSPIPLPPRELRRQPYAHEIAAAVDFARLERSWQAERDLLVGAWKGIQQQQIDELHGKISASHGDMTKLAAVEATPVGADLLEASMNRMATEGVAQALGEAKAQGVDTAGPDLAAIGKRLAPRASAVETLLARSFGEAASRKALSLAGGSLDSTAIADSVGEYLGGLSSSYLEEQLGGALSQALNTGRKAVMAETNPSKIYASELLDANTCSPCTDVDGTEYETLDDAEQDYPAGGFSDCDGGPRCRGTLVAVYDEAAPSA